MRRSINLKRRQDAVLTKKALSFDEEANMSGMTNLITGAMSGFSPFKKPGKDPAAPSNADMETEDKDPASRELFQDAKEEPEKVPAGPFYQNPDPLPCQTDDLLGASDALRAQAQKMPPKISLEDMLSILNPTYEGCVLDACLKTTSRIGKIYCVADIPGNANEKLAIVELFACNPKLAGKKAAKALSNIGPLRVAVLDATAEIEPADQPLCAALLVSNLTQTINLESPMKAWETRLENSAPTKALVAPPVSRTTPPESVSISLVGLEETLILSYTYMQDVSAQEFEGMTTPPLTEVKGFSRADDLPVTEGQPVGSIRLVWEDYTAQLAGNDIIRKEYNVRPAQHRFEEHVFWNKTTMTVGGGTLTEANVSTLQQLIRQRTKDLGAQLTLVPNSRGGPQKLQLTITDADTYYKIAQEKISVVLENGDKNWVLMPKRAELGPICNDPMALIIDGKNLLGYIGSADIEQALKMTGAAPPKTTVDLIAVDRRRFFLVQTYDPQFAATIWVGGLQMAYGKVVSVDLAYLWKSDVLKSQIPGISQDKAYDVVVKQNPRLLSTIDAARAALKGASKGKTSAASMEEPAEKKPRRMATYKTLTY